MNKTTIFASISIAITLACTLSPSLRNTEKEAQQISKAYDSSRTVSTPYGEIVIEAMKVADSVCCLEDLQLGKRYLDRVSQNDTLLFFLYLTTPPKGFEVVGGGSIIAIDRRTMRYFGGLALQ